MVIEFLITILLIIATLFLESTTLVLFNFSVFIVLALSLINRIDSRKWLITISLFTILLDIITHRSIGVTLLILCISCILLNFLFLVIPKAHDILSLLPYFISILVFYILITLFSPLISQGVIGHFDLDILFAIIIKSLISTLLIYIFNTLFTKFRGSKDSLL
jgi:hypothetical protein